MKLTKYGHSCLHVEQDADGQRASILIDPGSFSQRLGSLTGLTGILVTHVHADHMDTERIAALVQANPQASVHAEPAAAAELGKAGIAVSDLAVGQQIDLGISVQAFGGEHAVIHADLPRFGNLGYLIGGRLFHPGDSLQVPSIEVEILAVPVMAPWMALKEAIDFERAVAPKVAIPIHDALLPTAAKPMYYGRLEALGPDGMRWLDLDHGATVEL